MEETRARFSKPKTHELFAELVEMAGGRESVAIILGISRENLDKQCQGKSSCFLDHEYRLAMGMRSVPQEDGTLGICQKGLDLKADWSAKLGGGRYISPLDEDENGNKSEK